ncbi:hypothetical protein K7I13_02910 [Brucepastera parasyntrophica]|uniref:hypothetical protein n=1 Tax=Brucepastera parasyntrophica TaxID=2880008 RepID=UPI00210867DE|nr:hypothetical protein [Brucepastera parasyntrophica]ULQ60279.1 hypothetical protein K7I13_02910 [Brucepastera parasyntrophica]
MKNKNLKKEIIKIVIISSEDEIILISTFIAGMQAQKKVDERKHNFPCDESDQEGTC